MLDLLGFLTGPRIFLGALLGLFAGLAVAVLLHSFFGQRVSVEVLALSVAVGIIFGLVIGARKRMIPRE